MVETRSLGHATQDYRVSIYKSRCTCKSPLYPPPVRLAWRIILYPPSVRLAWRIITFRSITIARLRVFLFGFPHYTTFQSVISETLTHRYHGVLFHSFVTLRRSVLKIETHLLTKDGLSRCISATKNSGYTGNFRGNCRVFTKYHY